MFTKILVLKDNYNSFEDYYLSIIKDVCKNTYVYYKSNCKIRKLWTHYGMLFESFWYGEWKKYLKEFDLVIVFDSVHTSNLIKYIFNKCDARIIFWHWNPIETKTDLKILRLTETMCEHWTFDDSEATKYCMKKNTQFFSCPKNEKSIKENKAFFVGTNKGRYEKLVDIAKILELKGVSADFHVVDANKKGRFYQKKFMEYEHVLQSIVRSKFLVEIVQNGQKGLTARALEAMFTGTKLITDNVSIKEYGFYSKNNIYIIGEDTDIDLFVATEFENIDSDILNQYSVKGWLERFLCNK